MNEIWKDVVGYEGLYQVSNLGNVKSLPRCIEWKGSIRHQPERLLKPANNGKGYLRVCLCKNGKEKHCRVHRLVASAFIYNPNNLPEVNHIDENKTNNCVDNLEWCDHEYNINYGTHNQRIAEANKNGKRSIPVDMLNKQGDVIGEFPSTMEAERWLRANDHPKAVQIHITECCRGKRNIAYGFKWQYTN